MDDHRAVLDRRPAPATAAVTAGASGGHAPYHPKTAVRRGAGTKLRTRDATAMAVGGMIGGALIVKGLWRPSRWLDKINKRRQLKRIEHELKIIDGGKKDDLPI